MGNMKLPHNHKMVVSVIGYGKRKAITNKEIGKLTGIRDRRYISLIIEDLINNYGYIIGASRNGQFRGYYIIENEQELEETLFSFNNHIASMDKRRTNLRLNYSEYFDN